MDTSLDAHLIMTHITDNSNPASSFNSTEIVHLEPRMTCINILFKVIEKSLIRIVRSKSTGTEYKICECIVGDSTARIKLTLWNDDIELVEPDHSYVLSEGFISMHDECMILSKGRRGRITPSDEEIETSMDSIDMSRPFMGRQRKSKTRPVTTRTLEGTKGREARGYCSRKSF